MDSYIKDFYMYKFAKENPLALALLIEKHTGKDYLEVLEEINKSVKIIERI